MQKYKEQVDPELGRVAIKIPYNRAIIKFGNIFQSVSFRLTAVPKGIEHGHIALAGYRGLKFNVDIFEPSGVKGKLPCLLYAHGGAFSYKAASYHKKLACIYAAKAKCRVYFPDYHLAPKYPYPAAYSDVSALYKHIVKNSEKLGVDSEKIGVAGDSAGAALAALVCSRCEREGLAPPRLQMLIYPVTDIDMGTASMKRFSDTPLWNSKSNGKMWSYYCGKLKGKERCAASPMHCALPETIPDTYIETAEYDCLHDEGVMYGKKLQNAGAKVEINETKGTFHGYDLALNSKIASANVGRRILFLRKAFGGGSV